MKLNYTHAQAYKALSEYNAETRKYYSYMQVMDLFFPLIYALLLSALLTSLTYRLFPDRNLIHYVNIMPFLAALFDYLENIGIFVMIRRFPESFQTIAWITNKMSLFKFGLTGIAFSIWFILLIIFSVKKLITKPS